MKPEVMKTGHIVLRSLLVPLVLIGTPFLAAAGIGVPLGDVAVLIGSTLVIEYAAVIVGLGLDLPPWLVLYSVWIVALSVILFSFGIFKFLTSRSERLEKFLNRIEGYRMTVFIRKYGILGLFPGIIVVGFYICPAIAFIFGMRKDLAAISMLAGYATASICSLLIAQGFLLLFFT